jgi:lipopolysaccharide/colanic/teichoic acid biosynthesis glycosyltransferase
MKYGFKKLNLLTVKPGLTEISGRSDLSYDDRVRLDLYYIRITACGSTSKFCLFDAPGRVETREPISQFRIVL